MQKFKIKHQVLLKQIQALTHLTNLCYPTERTPDDDPMRYFQQREWRSSPHLLPNANCKPLTEKQKDELLTQDPEFFGRIWANAPCKEQKRLVDLCLYYQG